jgi:hypothetical protein
MNTETIQTESTVNSKAGSLLKWAVEHTLEKNWQGDNLGQIYLMEVKHLRGKSKTLYDTFYKLGYSSYLNLSHRIAYMPSCYDVQVVASVIFERTEAQRIELLIHKKLKQFSYKPKHKNWGGESECYDVTVFSKYPTLNSMVDAVLNPESIVSSPYNIN